jgi:acyl-CoA-binding protein
MSLRDDFESAQRRVKSLKSTPSNDELLELYGLYKQASVGDVQGARPSMLDFKGRAKYDAWQKRTGLSNEKAMADYVALVNRLAAKYG